MIDVSGTIDLIKLKMYIEFLYTSHLYNEGESEFHKEMTNQVVVTYVDPLNLPKNAKIIDPGCGPGYFLDAMKERGYTDLIGITLTSQDVESCKSKGHVIKQYDMSFLPQKDGYYEESVDFVFLRHALEHSPFPIFTLMEYNRVLKQGSKIYIEVPAPDCERQHENNLNHYSILGHNMIAALLHRTGFRIDTFNTLDFDMSVASPDKPEEPPTKYKERYFCVMATKDRSLDLK